MSEEYEFVIERLVSIYGKIPTWWYAYRNIRECFMGTVEAAIKTERERCAALEAENARLREALEAVEWFESNDGYRTVYVCPWCDEPEEFGHTADCKRQAALTDTAPREADVF